MPKWHITSSLPCLKSESFKLFARRQYHHLKKVLVGLQWMRALSGRSEQSASGARDIGHKQTYPEKLLFHLFCLY